MSDIFKGSDINVQHINENSTGALFVSFSAWSPSGVGSPFGLGFFKKHNIEAYLINQAGRNHWWHSSEMETVADIIDKRRESSGKQVILYGASMGGYGCIHLRKLFKSKTAIAVGSQVFVDKKILPNEARWPEDLNALQDRFIFNEILNFNDQPGELILFYDPLHQLDSHHIQKLKTIAQTGNIHLIEVPYSNHDVARLLSRTKFLQKLILTCNTKGFIDKFAIPDCSELYLDDYKSFFNFFRSLKKQTHSDRIDELIPLLNIYTASQDMDFEALYMAAECLSILGNYHQALEFMEKSRASYCEKYNKTPPRYLQLKIDHIKKIGKI